MIGKLSYNEVSAISKELQKQAEIIDKLAEAHNIPELQDFVATVEGYSKFLETTIAMNKDADEALKELKEKLD
jgi:hypothetical protein